METGCRDWTPAGQAAAPSIVLFFASGRLAARLTSYTLLLLLRRKHGLAVMVDRATMDSVTEFLSLTPAARLPVIEDTFCPAALASLRRHMEPFTPNRAGEEAEDLETAVLALRTGRAINLWPEGPLATSAYAVPSIQGGHGAWVHQQMRLRPEYHRDAAAKLAAIQAADTSGKELLFIGLHARRTDYPQFSREVLGERPAGREYYREAVDHFIEEFPDHKIYFVGVSDDLSWVRRHLSSLPGLVAAGSHGQDEATGLDSVGRDLALLAACNHTIVSQGQFGNWAAFLAGGDMFTRYGVLVKDIMS